MQKYTKNEVDTCAGQAAAALYCARAPSVSSIDNFR